MSKGQVIKLSISGVALVAASVFFLRYLTNNRFDPSLAARPITIRCEETGETWEMERGRIKDVLYSRSVPIDTGRGLSSPHAEGRPVAFPEDRGVWEDLVEEVEREKQITSS